MADYNSTVAGSGVAFDELLSKAGTSIQGDGSILSVVALSKEEYDALTPVNTTLYVTTDD